MKFLAYILAILLSLTISAFLSAPFQLAYAFTKAKLSKEPLVFWSGFWLGGIQSVILVLISSWIFSWFNYSIPVFFIILITLFILINNMNRYNTRPNKEVELGFLVGELIAIPCFFYGYYSGVAEFIFW